MVVTVEWVKWLKRRASWELRADLDDLAFEDFQGFLNQGIVLKVVFAERHDGWLFFH